MSFSLSEVKNGSFYFTIESMITSKTALFYSTKLSYILYLSVFHFLLQDFFKISHSIKNLHVADMKQPTNEKDIKIILSLTNIFGTDVMSYYSVITVGRCDVSHGKR